MQTAISSLTTLINIVTCTSVGSQLIALVAGALEGAPRVTTGVLTHTWPRTLVNIHARLSIGILFESVLADTPV